MAKLKRTEFKLSDEVFNMLQEVADNEFDGNRTAAIEDMIKHGSLVRSIDIDDRDKLRVSARNGTFSDFYYENERKMIDFFLV